MDDSTAKGELIEFILSLTDAECDFIISALQEEKEQA